MWLTFPSHFLIDQCVIKKKKDHQGVALEGLMFIY